MISDGAFIVADIFFSKEVCRFDLFRIQGFGSLFRINFVRARSPKIDIDILYLKAIRINIFCILAELRYRIDSYMEERFIKKQVAKKLKEKSK